MRFRQQSSILKSNKKEIQNYIENVKICSVALDDGVGWGTNHVFEGIGGKQQVLPGAVVSTLVRGVTSSK